jgi:membrane associated rhomboid family serine protease
VAAGIGGSIVAVLTSPPDVLSASASGAIMGLLGAMLAGILDHHPQAKGMAPAIRFLAHGLGLSLHELRALTTPCVSVACVRPGHP